MFGYLRTRDLELLLGDRENSKTYYCSVCNELRLNYGFAASLLTGWDAQFIGLLGEAQIQKDRKLRLTKCPAKLLTNFRPISMNNTPYRYAAAVEIVLFGEKLKDNINDDSSLSALLLDVLFKNKVQKATTILRNLGFPISELESLRKMQQKIEEVTKKQTIEFITFPTSKVVSLIFSYTALLAEEYHNIPILEEIGASVGRLIPIIDSCFDLRKDIKSKSFNSVIALHECPVNTINIHPLIALEVKDFVLVQLKTIRALVNDLILYRDSNLVTNILSLGFFDTCRSAMTELNSFISPSDSNTHNINECPNCGKISTGFFCPDCGEHMLIIT